MLLPCLTSAWLSVIQLHPRFAPLCGEDAKWERQERLWRVWQHLVVEQSRMTFGMIRADDELAHPGVTTLRRMTLLKVLEALMAVSGDTVVVYLKPWLLFLLDDCLKDTRRPTVQCQSLRLLRRTVELVPARISAERWSVIVASLLQVYEQLGETITSMAPKAIKPPDAVEHWSTWTPPLPADLVVSEEDRFSTFPPIVNVQVLSPENLKGGPGPAWRMATPADVWEDVAACFSSLLAHSPCNNEKDRKLLAEQSIYEKVLSGFSKLLS